MLHHWDHSQIIYLHIDQFAFRRFAAATVRWDHCAGARRCDAVGAIMRRIALFNLNDEKSCSTSIKQINRKQTILWETCYFWHTTVMYGTGIEPVWPREFLAVHHCSSSFDMIVRNSPFLKGRSSGSCKTIVFRWKLQFLIDFYWITHLSVKIKFCTDCFDFFHCRSNERSRV